MTPAALAKEIEGRLVMRSKLRLGWHWDSEQRPRICPGIWARLRLPGREPE
jgi:hypothetical protein